MRLLQVNQFYHAAGGTESYLQTILPALQQAGVTVGMLYCYPHAKDFHTGCWPEICLPALARDCKLPRAERERIIAGEIEKFNPDLIQLNNFDDPAALEWLCHLRPTVQFVHVQSPICCPGDGKYLRGQREVCTRPMSRFCLIAPWLQQCGTQRPWQHIPNYLRARQYQRAAAGLRDIIVASSYMRDEMMLNGFSSAKISVVPLPGTADITTNDMSNDQPPLVLFVGRLSEHKGCDRLIDACARIATPLHLVIVGDGVERAALTAQAAQLSAHHRVTFTGWLTGAELTQWYARARVVAVPSMWAEPFGLIGLEAMAHARPVVAFDRGGIAEWLQHEVNGLLVPANDLARFAEALESLCQDRARAQAMGIAGEKLLMEKFTIECHIARLLAIYQAVIGGEG